MPAPLPQQQQRKDGNHPPPDINDEEEANSKSFESVFKLVGASGRFQWFCIVVCNVQLLMLTWNHMGYMFLGGVPNHWCHVPALSDNPLKPNWTREEIRNISIPISGGGSGTPTTSTTYDSCNYFDLNYTQILLESNGDFHVALQLVNSDSNVEKKTRQCESWEFDNSMYKSTIATEFNLVCGRRYLVASIQALYMIGAFVGTLTFGPLNDRLLGRRKANLIAIILVLVGGFCSAFSISYAMFIVCRFAVAIGTAGAMQAGSVWVLEHLDTRERAKLYLISGLGFGLGYAILPLFAYVFRDWSSLQIAFSTTTLSLLCFFWIFPESPRWLATNGQEAEAVKSLLRIARINKVSPSPDPNELLKIVRRSMMKQDNNRDANDDELTALSSINNSAQPNNKMQKNKNQNLTSRKLLEGIKNFRTLVATKELRRISFTMWALFVAVAFVYYGLAFSSGSIVGGSGWISPYLIVSIGAIMEFPASLLPIPFLSWFGRRPTITICYVLTGLSALTIAIIPRSSELSRTILSLIGKLFISSVFTVQYLVVSEVYPTVVRSTGQGGGSLAGRFGSIAAPFVADLLTTVYPDLPILIFALVALTASIIAFLLIPEMKGVDMKDQVHQILLNQTDHHSTTNQQRPISSEVHNND